MMRKILSVILTAGLLSACSLVKNPQSANFQRVKYRAHLKLNSPLQTKKLNDEKYEKLDNIQVPLKREKELTVMSLMEHRPAKSLPYTVSAEPKRAFTLATEELRPLTSVFENQETIKMEDFSSLIVRPIPANEWWNKDVEDWNGKDIVLAVLAIIIAVLLIVLLISILDVLLGSIIGLLIVLLLIYLIFLNS